MNAPSLKNFKSGDIIMRQGDTGDSAYIIEEGRVEIHIERPDGSSQLVGTRGKGAIIGEMALVDKAPRTATIKALEDCKMTVITLSDFSRRLENTDPVLRMISQVILTRYRDTLRRAEIRHDKQNWPPAEALELNYTEQSTEAVESIKIANEFKDALGSEQITLNYQPIIDLNTADIAGFEALMRWNHPDRGFISPGIFIPVAEETGYIVKASQWALKESCQAIKRIGDRSGRRDQLFMSVNFSSSDFASEDFTGSVYETVSKCDIRPEQLHIEITERLLMQQPENARETLKMCRKSGMGISIDDFGTGYSSLSYLHYFPIDTLKIDQTFVREMTKDESSLELIKSIIALGKNMKLKIIAEGVEEKEEAALLRDLGCDMAQGYYFAKPTTEKDVTNLVKTWQSPVY